jgi:hypothetical protein
MISFRVGQVAATEGVGTDGRRPPESDAPSSLPASKNLHGFGSLAVARQIANLWELLCNPSPRLKAEGFCPGLSVWSIALGHTTRRA